ncbi:MAG: FAD-dependent thymidylate synthase [Aquificaceae bacterium]
MDIHMMGSDQRIVRCARVSFALDDTVDVGRDKKLIRYLFDNRHASPFEHVVVAYRASKREWLKLIEGVGNPTFQAYYSGGYVWLNLRNLINAMDSIGREIKGFIKDKLPAVWSVISGEPTEGYSVDKAFLLERFRTSSGWVGLVDKLELDSEMDYYTFVVECPLFVARQWFRHRFGSYNEVSRRYVGFEPSFYIPEHLRKQAKKNRQASEDESIEEPFNSIFLERIKNYTHELKALYAEMIEKNVAKEIARGILPQFMLTRFYWTVPRVSLDNFIRLRTHEGAQKEIREFAKAIDELVGYRETDKMIRL